MLKALVKKTLMEIWAPMIQNSKNGKRRSRKGIIGFSILYAVLLLFLMGVFFGLGMSFGQMVYYGLGWFFFLFMGMMSILLGVFGDVFNTQATLYNAKDNESLMALPIPTGTILLARLLNVVIMGVMYSSLVMVPSIVAYWICSPKFTAGHFIGTLTLQLVSVVSANMIIVSLTTGLGFLVAMLSRKVKNKSFITVVLTVLFLGVYYFFCFRIQYIIQDILMNAEVLSGKIASRYYPLYVFGKAFDGGWKEALILFVVSSAILYGVYRILCATYHKIVTSNASSSAKTTKVAKVETMQSVKKALIKRELKKFGSSAVYMMNAGLGILLFPSLAVVVFIKAESIRAMLTVIAMESELVSTLIPVIAATAIMTLAGMNQFTPPAISLEGKNLWILQSLPIDILEVLKAKLTVGFLLTFIPGILFTLSILYVFNLGLGISMGIVMVFVSFALFSNTTGLVMGILKPNLHWTNEAAVVKQGLPVTVNLFGAWIMGVAETGVFYLLRKYVDAETYLMFSALLFLVLSGLLNRFLYGKAKEIVAHL